MNMLGIIRVLTTEDNQLLQEHSVLLNEKQGILSESRCIPDQPYGIFNEATYNVAEEKIVQLAHDWAASQEIDALTISCAADPALDLCRERIGLPIIGAGEAGALEACKLSEAVGVLGLTPEVPKRMRDILGKRLVGQLVPEEVVNTTDLLEEDAIEKAVAASSQLMEQGAEVILFACTGFSTIHLKESLQEEIHIPIIDLVEAQGRAYQNHLERRNGR
ncbi:LOW QUALITY PROTEIN: hydantoin racemase [Bacillus sp. JCM 19046]|nr:LOW QUALITY PROTEIN: hydantoin racemase [Bacillus sp. JCM 19046]